MCLIKHPHLNIKKWSPKSRLSVINSFHYQRMGGLTDTDGQTDPKGCLTGFLRARSHQTIIRHSQAPPTPPPSSHARGRENVRSLRQTGQKQREKPETMFLLSQ